MAAELSSLSRRRAEDELGESEPLVEAMSARLKEELVRAAAIATNADVADGLRRSASMYDLWLLRFLRLRKYRVAEATANVVGYLRWINVLESLPPDFGGEWVGQKKTEEKSDAATSGQACEAAMQTGQQFGELSFWNLHLKDVAPFLSCSAIKMLPGRDVNGAAILYLKSVDELFCSIRQHPIKQWILGMQYLLDQMALEPNTQVCGVGVVYNLSGYSFSLLKQLELRGDIRQLQKEKMKAMKTGFPFRFADLWLIDAPWYLYFVWFALWCFMSRDLRCKVHLISSKDLSPMHKVVPKASLPITLGGNLTEAEINRSYHKWLDERLIAEGSQPLPMEQ